MLPAMQLKITTWNIKSVRLRKQDAQERNEQQLILETYMNALGMLAA